MKTWTGVRNIRGFIVELDQSDGLYHAWRRGRVTAGWCLLRGDRVVAHTPEKVGAYRTLYGAAQACRRVKRGGLLPQAEKHRAARAWIALAS